MKSEVLKVKIAFLFKFLLTGSEHEVIFLSYSFSFSINCYQTIDWEKEERKSLCS
jgi:hypothetical protein